MICTSIINRDLKGVYEAMELPAMEMAEIRLDSCELSLSQIEELFSCSDFPLVATCRISQTMPPQKAEARLLAAIHAGATYVDLELEAPAMMSKRLRREARECGTLLIRSYHDFTGTDSFEALKAVVEKCQSLGADLVKLATTANSKADVDRVMSLYGQYDEGSLIAFCMGEIGKTSRIECLKSGSPFSYAALNDGEAAAPGQWPTAQMSQAVYGGFRMVGYSSMDGEMLPLKMPSSKSFAQRAIIAAALAEGESRLSGYSPCGDNEAAVAVALALGAEVNRKGNELVVQGIGAGRSCLRIENLHTGESGFLTRLMIPLLAELSTMPVTVTGEGTLGSRPLKGAREIMEAFGVTIESDTDEVKVPLTLRGSLRPGDIEISGKDGSQLISGLLAALPLAAEDSLVYVKDPKSIPYIFMTIDVLKRFGVEIRSELEGGDEFIESHDWNYCDALTLRIRGRQLYHPANLDIEGDWSAAANFLVAGAVFGCVDLKGLDTKSLQADLTILDLLADAGAMISKDTESEEIHVQRSPLRAIEADAGNCPDLFPIISVLAAFCQGTSRIRGVGRLVGKESNRAQGILDMLGQMGVKAWIKSDTLFVQGHSLCQRILSGNLLNGGRYSSNHDHRMVMALKVAALGASGPVEIDDIECVSKSFPAFFEEYNKL